MRCSLCFFAFFCGKNTFLSAANFMLPECLFAAQQRGGFVVEAAKVALQVKTMLSSYQTNRAPHMPHTTHITYCAARRPSPHVIEWWGTPGVEREIEKLTDCRIAMWIVEHEGRPFAFAQDYDVHGWVPTPFSHLPPGSRGIDQYIGEANMLDQGHGSTFVRLHVQRLTD